MTNPTTPFGWQMPTSTDLVTDLPADFETFGQAVATSMADLLGGTTGQVLSKASNTDMDFSWVAADDTNAIQNTIVDAKGDLISATGSDVPARLAVGTNGQVLTADSSAATGLKWAPGGKVLQVVNATTATAVSSATNVLVDTTLTATITPLFSTSKILVFVSQNGLGKTAASSGTYGELVLLRGASGIATLETQFAFTGSATDLWIGASTSTYLDSPATTAATTYKTQFKNVAAAGAVFVQVGGSRSGITLMEIGA
jgi:hypothetical protein